MQNRKNKNKVFTRRAMILGMIKLSLFGVLSLRFGYLQIFSNSRYKNIAAKNSMKIIIIPAVRGILLDRHDNVMTENITNYALMLDLTDNINPKETIGKIESILQYQTQISKISLKKAIQTTDRNSYILIQDNLSLKDILLLEENNDLQGIYIVQNRKRYYKNSTCIAHITGYVGRVTAVEIEQSAKPFYYKNLTVGKSGVEKQFNDILLGEVGARKIEVNAKGRFMKEVSAQPPVDGKNVKLSIDFHLQQIVAEKLANISGSTVVIDALSGHVLALHSTPTYDPNLFVGGVQSAYWTALQQDKNKPLINKSIAAVYPPGSIFKIVTALAILKAGIDPSRRVLCTGEYRYGNRKFRCWKECGHGLMNLHDAIMHSCNVYFYTLSMSCGGIESMREIASKLGFGERTRIELPAEAKGFLPSQEWIDTKLHHKWSFGDMINSSIGQGYILTTPIQLCLALAKIATGADVKPTLLYSAQNVAYEKLNIPPEHLQIVRNGLYGVFNEPQGTGYNKRFYDPNYVIYGKTGTAQVASQSKRNQNLAYTLRDHGLFAGYVTLPDQKVYAISTVVEHGGWGSGSALPIAKSIMEEYLKKI